MNVCIMIIVQCAIIQEIKCNASLLFAHLPFVRIHGISDCIHNCVSMYVHPFQGVNLQHVPESDYSVTVGGQPCIDLNVNDAGTAITCLPPVVAQVNAPIVVSG